MRHSAVLGPRRMGIDGCPHSQDVGAWNHSARGPEGAWFVPALRPNQASAIVPARSSRGATEGKVGRMQGRESSCELNYRFAFNGQGTEKKDSKAEDRWRLQAAYIAGALSSLCAVKHAASYATRGAEEVGLACAGEASYLLDGCSAGPTGFSLPVASRTALRDAVLQLRRRQGIPCRRIQPVRVEGVATQAASS